MTGAPKRCVATSWLRAIVRAVSIGVEIEAVIHSLEDPLPPHFVGVSWYRRTHCRAGATVNASAGSPGFKETSISVVSNILVPLIVMSWWKAAAALDRVGIALAASSPMGTAGCRKRKRVVSSGGDDRSERAADVGINCPPSFDGFFRAPLKVRHLLGDADYDETLSDRRDIGRA
jgi:hypothetical protein